MKMRHIINQFCTIMIASLVWLGIVGTFGYVVLTIEGKHVIGEGIEYVVAFLATLSLCVFLYLITRERNRPTYFQELFEILNTHESVGWFLFIVFVMSIVGEPILIIQYLFGLPVK